VVLIQSVAEKPPSTGFLFLLFLFNSGKTKISRGEGRWVVNVLDN
jgi:hypothetical protein